MADPELQIRRGGGESLENFVFSLRASVWSKNKGGRPPPGPPPLEPSLNYLSKLQGTKSSNRLSPKSNQHHISPCNINAL